MRYMCPMEISMVFMQPLDGGGGGWWWVMVGGGGWWLLVVAGGGWWWPWELSAFKGLSGHR